MKKFISFLCGTPFKNLLIVTLAAFAVMAILPFVNDGTDMVPLDPNGHYSYPDFCIGHEEDFLVNANNTDYQKGLYVDDIEYIGGNGDFAYKDLHLETSTYTAETNSFYNESLNLGFKLPEGWQAVSPTPTDDEEYTYIYDFGAASPDGNYSIVVKYHDISADGINVKTFVDYNNAISDPYYEKGYTNFLHTNVFLADKYCHFKQCANQNDAEMGKLYVAYQLLNKDYAMIIELYTPYNNSNNNILGNFYSK